MGLFSGGLLVLGAAVQGVVGSLGDRSVYYQDCYKLCLSTNCNESSLPTYYEKQPLELRLTLWDCRSECQYDCMWKTVEWCKENNYIIPQFHGKWPFKRYFGIQEPASAIFSLLNFLAFLHFYRSTQTLVRRSFPLARLWMFYALMGLFTWTWSTIFHSRDTPFTELMDYFCAFASILLGCYVCFVRIIGWEKWIVNGILSAFTLGFFIRHTGYLYFVHFDYGYNIKVNVIVGITNSVSWLGWSLIQARKGRWRQIRPLVGVVVWANLCLTLELWDFPPWWWTIDAHSLWHLSTVPLPILWARFVSRDCEYLHNQKFGHHKLP